MKCGGPPPSAVLVALSRHELPPFRRCALVGTGSNLAGARLGSRIDRDHDTVIRINRLPTADYAADVGARTTIYFKNQLSELVVNRSSARARVKVRRLGAPATAGRSKYESWCDLLRGSNASCPFGALVYEGALDASKRWPSRVLAAAHFGVARQSDALHLFQTQVLGLGRARPPFEGRESAYQVRATAGAKAAFTFALLCDSLALFGFGGEGTVDRHVARVGGSGGGGGGAGGHDYQAEHRFLARMASGHLAADDLPSDMPAWWPRGASATSRETRHRAVRAEFLRFARSLVCRARARRIHMFPGAGQ